MRIVGEQETAAARPCDWDVLANQSPICPLRGRSGTGSCSMQNKVQIQRSGLEVDTSYRVGTALTRGKKDFDPGGRLIDSFHLKKFCNLLAAHSDSSHVWRDGVNCLHDSQGSCCTRLVVDFMHGALLGARRPAGMRRQRFRTMPRIARPPQTAPRRSEIR
ncbi:hypothetical protein APV28_0726 [Comamonas testosteroni]|nr:hypothetical protein APV28_0726 [Comamonas testosteroni]